MGLPLSRTQTCTAGSPVSSGLLNLIQDSLISKKHGLVTVPLDVRKIVAALSGSQAPTVLESLSSVYRQTFACSSTPIGAMLVLDSLPVGTRIEAVRAIVKDVSGQPGIQMAFQAGDKSGSSATTFGPVTSAATGATQTLTFAPMHIVGVTSPGMPFLKFSTLTNASGSFFIYSVEIDISKP